MSIPGDLSTYLIIAGLALASFLLKKLTLAASIIAFFVAVFTSWSFDSTGLAALGLFFVLGVIATSWGKRQKEAYKEKSDRGSRRNVWQVLANGGVAAACGLIDYIIRQNPAYPRDYERGGTVFCVMLLGSLAAATADTLSSELGMVYGRRFFNVLTLKPDQKGRDGVISIEGTLIGIAGAAVIAMTDISDIWFNSYFWIVIAGAAGNLVDSILGATLERKGYLNNDQVNFLNTLTGALVALILALLRW